MFSNSYFGLVLTFVVFELAKHLNKKIHNGIIRSIFNPLLVSIIVISVFLSVSGISYVDYNKGGSIVSFFIGPATVALMVSLYDNIEILKANWKAIFLGIFAGTFVSMLISILLAKAFGVDYQTLVSILPESVTTAIAIGLSEEYGGIAALTTISVVIRGIIGIIISPIIISIFKIYDPIAQGLGLGTISHALGTTKAREMGDVQGAMSGLAIAIAGIMTVILMPAAVLLVNII